MPWNERTKREIKRVHKRVPASGRANKRASKSSTFSVWARRERSCCRQQQLAVSSGDFFLCLLLVFVGTPKTWTNRFETQTLVRNFLHERANELNERARAFACARAPTTERMENDKKIHRKVDRICFCFDMFDSCCSLVYALVLWEYATSSARMLVHTYVLNRFQCTRVYAGRAEKTDKRPCHYVVRWIYIWVLEDFFFSLRRLLLFGCAHTFRHLCLSLRCECYTHVRRPVSMCDLKDWVSESTPSRHNSQETQKPHGASLVPWH